MSMFPILDKIKIKSTARGIWGLNSKMEYKEQ